MHGMNPPFCGFLRCRSAALGDKSSILRVSSPPSLAGDPGHRRSHLLLQRSGHQRVPPPGRKLLEASTVAQSCRVLLLHCCRCPGTYVSIYVCTYGFRQEHMIEHVGESVCPGTYVSIYVCTYGSRQERMIEHVGESVCPSL